MLFTKKWLSILLMLFSASVLAENIQILHSGPIHECLVSQEHGTIVLAAVPLPPPLDVTEQKPPQSDPQLIWIKGYWKWDYSHGDYLWVSGMWRRPPPGCQWIKGHWKLFPKGWAWISGFWSARPENKLTFIPEAPPEVLDEKVISPSAQGGNFWVPGYWHYDEKNFDFAWHAGRWHPYSEEWVLTPSHYIWTERGHVFVPAFWDWPLEKRGTVFSSVYIDPDYRSLMVYEPTITLDPLFAVEYLYPFWPDYRCFFQQHYHSYQSVWVLWGGSPPWWQWDTWWSYTPKDLWALWWWWSHPHYPNPSWMSLALASDIQPPPNFIVSMMKKIQPPLYVTRNGVVSVEALLQALFKATGRKMPVFPSDPKQVIEIQSLALPVPPLGLNILPTGSRNVKAPPRVNATLPIAPLKYAPERLQVPLPPKEKPIAFLEIAQLRDLKDIQEPFEADAPPEYYPPGKYNPPVYSPNQPPIPRYETPYQGSMPDYPYPQYPMELEDHADIQSHPQPQRNPLTPRTNPLPGEEATYPNFPPPHFYPPYPYSDY